MRQTELHFTLSEVVAGEGGSDLALMSRHTYTPTQNYQIDLQTVGPPSRSKLIEKFHAYLAEHVISSVDTSNFRFQKRPLVGDVCAFYFLNFFVVVRHIIGENDKY